MSEKTTVIIGNQEYILKGNRDLILKSAKEIDEQLKELKDKHYEESDYRLATLAALNNWANHYNETEQTNSNLNYVLSEIKKMTEKIKNHQELNYI